MKLNEVVLRSQMWHFIGSKKESYGFGILDFVTGNRECRNRKKTLEKVKDIDCEMYSSDNLKAYKKFIKKLNT
ncbi:MAG: hypothetical protein ACK5IC_05660 [Moheibacter sp.]